MVYYFAYGSNMDEDRLKDRMKKTSGFCSNFSVGTYKVIGLGTLEGYKLVFNKINNVFRGAGYANIIKEDSTVEGIIFEIDDNGMKRLDCNEGVSSGHYYKKYININTKKGTLNCAVYIANDDKTKDGLKPTKEYLSCLLKGKEYLSEEYYEKLTKIETID
jgi:gamma-glutamylcyclotransferase